MAGVSPLLGLGIATAGIPKAIMEGRQAGTEQFNKEQDRKTALEDHKLNREIAYQKKQLMDFKLAEAGRADTLAQATQGDKTALLEQQLQTQQQESRALSGKLLKQESFTALNNFFDSGDPQSLNTFFQDNPKQAQQLFDTLRVEQLNLDSSEDRKLLLDSGVSQDELDALDGKKDGKIDWAKVGKRYVKTVHPDGSTSISDVVAKAAAMGYGRYADEQRLAKMKALADISKKVGTGSKGTALMQNATAVAAAQDRIDNGKGTTADYSLIRFGNKELGGIAPGKESMANDARSQWTAEGFDKLSIDKLRASGKARRLVNQIELAHKVSESDKKKLIDLNSMISLSSEAGKLNQEQTGLWDKMTNNVSSYVSENVGSKKERAAYGAFINQFRHNLFGSALTDGELAAFKEAYSGLGQKTGPVLAGLRAALIQTKSQMETIANFNDPIVMRFRTGKSQAEISQSLAGINQRIKFYDLVSSGKTPEEAAKLINKKKSTGAPALGADATVEDVSSALGL